MPDHAPADVREPIDAFTLVEEFAGAVARATRLQAKTYPDPVDVADAMGNLMRAQKALHAALLSPPADCREGRRTCASALETIDHALTPTPQREHAH